MTNAEVKAAFMDGCPVSYSGIEYLEISALIYRRGPDGFYMQAELLDKNRNSVTIARPDRITEVCNENEN